MNEVLVDKDLAKLGDAYVNFVWSLALSEKKGKATGEKVKSSTLAEALRRSGLRKSLAKRFDRHAQGDAAEALIVYSLLRGVMPIQECVNLLCGVVEDPVQAFVALLEEIKRRLEAAQ